MLLRDSLGRGQSMASSPIVEFRTGAEDALQGAYHFFDVGAQKYGECTLVVFGNIRILIDGGHQEDFEGQNGYASIPEQLAEILGEPPFDITLLMVTHCHHDHIGCLVELVANGVIRPKHALITDPKLGFGRAQNHDVLFTDAADEPRRLLEAALREEDASDLDDDELADFIDRVGRVEARYHRLTELLEENGVSTTFYQGQPLPEEIVRAVAGTGLTLLGPSQDQLLFCAEQIATTNQQADEAAGSAIADAGDVTTLYREIVEAETLSDGRNPRGSGMNCQSITIALGPPEARVLLAGDMQFTEPGVRGADEEVEKLREAVIAAGPYRLFKTTHHTAHNGQDAAFLTELGDPPLIVHSGGLKDEHHPNAGMLRTLERRRGIRFARTDRNGLITVHPHRELRRAIDISRGAINDFEANVREDETQFAFPGSEIEPQQTRVADRMGAQIIIVNLPPGPVDMSVAGVEIRVRSPEGGAPQPRVEAGDRRRQRVGGGHRPAPAAGVRLAGGRTLPRLLFVTDRAKLRANIGASEADAALAAVESGGGELVSAAGPGVLEHVRRFLASSRDTEGVVLLGGYDVVPSFRVDVLGPALRSRLSAAEIGNDGDRFVVWSDQAYGDSDGDSIAELPVSRIPDGRDARLFLTALQAKGLSTAGRFGVRNVARPFAEDVWAALPGRSGLYVSEPFLAPQVASGEAQAPCHYLMLHGMAEDGRYFTGESSNGGYPTAFAIGNVPARFEGLVFTGCCWGALTVNGRAAEGAGTIPPPRVAEESIALAYLKAGAVAYIGCTGSHYSGPARDVNANFARRLHEAFWGAIASGIDSPAVALHQARRSYGEWIAATGTRVDALRTARRLKNFSQFTCLGLGW